MENKYPELFEKKIESKQIYDGVVVKLYKDLVELPNGQTSVREIVRHNGAVAVLPITDEGDVLCVRQYRYAFDRVTLEIPAGKLDTKDEDHVSAALRELREETGAACEKLVYIGDVHPSVAIFDEVIHLYYATGLTFGETDPDDDEFLEPERVPLIKLKQMVLDGEIKDAKTQIAVLKVAAILGY